MLKDRSYGFEHISQRYLSLNSKNKNLLYQTELLQLKKRVNLKEYE